ncbi:MAG TPA: Na+/H+ antiporter [Opitutaceae bacterium]|nr:Na+/H+ antiporter [Opitutaceae bacterium]
MTAFDDALILLLLVAALSVIGRRLPWPQLITWLAGGILAAFVPAIPRIPLDPGLFFFCFLPPLLFADGWLMPLREFVQNRRAILLLAVGLVMFTTALVGLAAWWLVPGLPLAMAFALGAIVSPTDAVAVNAITSRLRVPARVTTILNGESLMNDATGLVAFQFALAAVAAGGFSAGRMTAEFLLLAGGGSAVGLAVGWAVGRLRDLLQRLHADEPVIEITLSLMTPFAAYLAAHRLELSGILAVVAAGLYSGWRDPVRMSVETRQQAYAVWGLFLFWLNGIAFVLLGLQVPALVAAVGGRYSAAQLAGFALAVSLVAIAARLAWIYAGIFITRFSRGLCADNQRAKTGFVMGWAGMRGTVTLAGALSIPLALPDGTPFPGRDIVVFLAFGVIAVTLVLQGSTLEALIRRLDLPEDGTLAREELLARTAAVEAGLKVLRAQEAAAAGTPETAAAIGQVISEYEHRLATLTAEGETRRSALDRRRATQGYRVLALQAERQAVDDLWRSNRINDDVHRPLQQLLDHEESLLRGSAPPPA